MKRGVVAYKGQNIRNGCQYDEVELRGLLTSCLDCTSFVYLLGRACTT